jgi:hypothetical protein
MPTDRVKRVGKTPRRADRPPQAAGDRYLPTIRANGECRKLRKKPLERGTHAGRCIVCAAVKGREAAQNEGYLLLRLALTLSAPVTYGRSGPDEASL